jgi:putative DNA primase/helicase
MSEKVIDYGCDDIGNKDRFVRQHGDKVRYIAEEKKWVAWDGTRWSPEKVRIYKRAEQTAKSIHDEAKRHNSRELSNWAHRSRNGPALREMLRQAADALSVSIKEFDRDADSINCQNGIINLRTGQRVEHDPAQLVMKQVKATYDPDAHCPRWLQFLDEVFQGDAELVEWLQRALGYSLSGRVNEQFMFLLEGKTGENGKTKFAETVLHILGDYARTAQFESFTEKKNKSARDLEATAELKGIRFARAVETGNTRWNEPLVKQITGSDTLRGAKLYGGAFEFQPTTKFWMLCNRLPNFYDGSHSLRRRFRVIPFRVNFEKTGTRDKEILDKLLAERDGIFAWMVEGARRYFEMGLSDVPRTIKEATDAYVEENDHLKRFIEEHRDPQARPGSNALYVAYTNWCALHGEAPCEQRNFKKNLEEREIDSQRTKKGVVFIGVGLRPRGDEKPNNQHWEDKGEGVSVYRPSSFEDYMADRPKVDWREEHQKMESSGFLKN